jgi:branched-chain amino acid transport system ATP-binding protein
MPELRVNGIDVFYGQIQALWNISLSANEGLITSIIGPNGAGKSTLLRAIIGLTEVKKGSIELGGERIENKKPDRIVEKGVAYVPEGRRLFPSLSVYENLIMGSYPKHSRKDRNTELEHIYGLFPVLKERANQKAGQLSGGEAQMLAIGRALMSRPKVLLLDEPSAGIAPKITETIFDALTEISRSGVSIILVEQDVVRALTRSDFAYLMENGRIVKSGEGKKLLGDEYVKKAYLGI